MITKARSLAILIIFVIPGIDITLCRVILLSQHAFVSVIFKGEAVGGEGRGSEGCESLHFVCSFKVLNRLNRLAFYSPLGQ